MRWGFDVCSPLNTLELSGVLERVNPLRTTPSGLAAISIVLTHRSTVTEMTGPRQLAFQTEAVAFGSVAESLSKAQVGQSVTLRGYIAPKFAGDKAPMQIHITQLTLQS